MPCVIKFDHDIGSKLSELRVILWFGGKKSGWVFQDAQYAALAGKPVCNKCRANIKLALYNNL